MILLTGLLIAGLSQAQQPASVECRTGKGIGREIHLFRVDDGKKVSIARAEYGKNGYYGFRFIPEYEGFYVVGNTAVYQFPVYLKPGDAVSLYMDQDTVYLTGRKNTPENTVLYRWHALAANIEAKAIRFSQTKSTYKDFFPDFEAFLPAADRFKSGIKTKNSRFNELMKRSIDFEKDYYALNFLYTPRSELPSKEQRIPWYSGIIDSDKFQDEVILQMPYGMDLIRLYTMFGTLEQNKQGKTEEVLPLIANRKIKGELVVNGADRLKTYPEYQEYAGKYEQFLDVSQKARLDAVGSRLYQTRKGLPAADFTYPDAAGKQISLSDFKGKVVVVDVWATWCGPCRKELPYLKNLEKELKDEEVVFIGVSLDEDKNLEKWKKFIVDEQLPGVQLFAGGWSKIAKDYKITGIPRFMVFDKQGCIVEVNAPRPSDPALKKLLKQELEK